jgi:ankyrin repeat protein
MNTIQSVYISLNKFLSWQKRDVRVPAGFTGYLPGIGVLCICLVLMAGCRSRESYRNDLEVKGIPFSGASFFSAVAVGNTGNVRLFLKAGMDVNVKGGNGETAVMLAAALGDTGMVKLLLKEGGMVNAQNNDGYPALMFASSDGNIEMMKLLVARGAATDIQNHKGETPLMLASLNDRKEAVILLLEEGADVHLKNSKGESALTYAFLNKEIQSVIKTAMKKK